MEIKPGQRWQTESKVILEIKEKSKGQNEYICYDLTRNIVVTKCFCKYCCTPGASFIKTYLEGQDKPE
jgi:hypothetical protein